MALHVIDIGPLGPLIQVGIQASAVLEAAGLGGAPHSDTALIDTGASASAISSRVVAQVQPLSIGSATLNRVGVAVFPVMRYDVRLKFESHLSPGRWFDMRVVETAPATPGVDVLIGQDLLLELTLLDNGPVGKLVLMYRGSRRSAAAGERPGREVHVHHQDPEVRPGAERLQR